MTDFADKLTSGLQRLLASVVPPGFEVRAARGVVTIQCEGSALSASTHVAEIVEHHEEREGAQITTLQALSTAQDFISEALHEPWPPVSSRGRSYMALPQAQFEGGRLHLWFGEPTRVMVEVGVLELSGG